MPTVNVGSESNPNPSQSRPNTQTISRVVQMRIRGSMDGFEKTGSNAASWQAANGKLGEIFGVNDVFDRDNLDDSVTAAALQGAVIEEVELLSVRNDFPVDIGVTISCIPSQEATKHGTRYAFTAMNRTFNPQPQVLYQSNGDTEISAWREQYPDYNSSNIETQGTLSAPGQPFIFVDQNHPSIELLRQNMDILDQDIDSYPLIDNQYFKLARQVFSTACQVLRQKVLSTYSAQDLNNFSMQIHRIGQNGQQRWVCPSAQDDMIDVVPHEYIVKGESIAQYLTSLYKREHSFTARMRIKYSVSTAS